MRLCVCSLGCWRALVFIKLTYSFFISILNSVRLVYFCFRFQFHFAGVSVNNESVYHRRMFNVFAFYSMTHNDCRPAWPLIILVSYHHYFTLLIPFNVSFLYTHRFEWVLITLAMHIEVEWMRWVRRKEEIERALPLTCDSCSQNVYAELTNVYSRCSFGQYAENDFACIMA